MRRGRRGFWIAAALLLVVPALAAAAIVATTVVPDTGGDSPAKFDIESVTVDTTGDNMLRHLVKLTADFTPTDMIVPSGPPPAICVLIWTKRIPGEDRPDYQLCATPTQDGRKLRGTLARLPTTGVPRRVSIVEADRPDAKSVALEVTKSDLGKPRSYKFSAQVQGPAAAAGVECPKYTGCVDYAPERGTFQTFRP